MTDDETTPNPDTIADVVGEGTRDEIRDRLRASAAQQLAEAIEDGSAGKAVRSAADAVVASLAQPKPPPKHGFIRIVRSGVPGPDGVDTNLTSFLAEAKRRGQKVLDVYADEDRNEHVIKVMRLTDGQLEKLETFPPATVDAMPDIRAAIGPDDGESDILRKRREKEAKRAARFPVYKFMRILAGEGGRERLKKAIRDARRAGVKVVDYRLDEEAGHYVIRALNEPPKRKTKRR